MRSEEVMEAMTILLVVIMTFVVTITWLKRKSKRKK